MTWKGWKMLRHILVSAIVLALMAPHPAFPEDNKSSKDCDVHLSQTLQTLDDLEALVPFVPPEEITYLSQEFDAASRTKALARLGPGSYILCLASLIDDHK
jgi:hypothetical protein